MLVWPSLSRGSAATFFFRCAHQRVLQTVTLLPRSDRRIGALFALVIAATPACDDKSGEQNAEGPVAAADAPRHAISVTVKGETGDALVLVSVPDGWPDAKVAKSLTAPLHQVQKTCGGDTRPDYALDVKQGKVAGVTTQVDADADACVVKALGGIVIDDAKDAPTGKVYVRWPDETPKATAH